MIDLLKYTYLMEPEKVGEELDRLWNRYQEIINKKEPDWEEINEARSILYLTSQKFCEEIAVEAIERRLHLLKNRMTLMEFFNTIDKNSEKLGELRKDELFSKLERFYKVIKGFKNRQIEGKHYHDEDKFLKKYDQANPYKELKIGYRGSF